MPRNILITFGGALYDDATQLIVERGPLLGADEVWVYDDLWLTQQPFYEINRWLWDHPHKRGFGWYCWKPFIIMDALNRCKDYADVVMYTDGDCYPVADFSHLYKQCRWENGVKLFRASGHKNYKWVKRDAYIIMGLDTPQYQSPALDAGVARFTLFQKGPWLSQQILAAWLTYATNRTATTFDPSVLGPELPGFNESRAEQAILSLLAYQFGVRLYPELDYEQGLFCQANSRPPDTRQETAPILGSRYCNV